MKTKKRRFPNFQYRECDAFAEYLHQQSLKGWHFKEWRFGLVFEQGEPKDIMYTVEVFPKGSEQDLRPGDDTKEYAEYCEAAGWKLLDAHGKFCIFKRTRKDAVPIVEAEERLENIRKAEWKRWRNSSLTALILTPIYLLQFWTLDFENWVFSNEMLFLMTSFLMISILFLWEGILLLIWCKKQNKMLTRGEHVSYGKNRFLRVRGIVLIIVFLIFEVIGNSWTMQSVLITFVLLGIVSIIIAFWRPSATGNSIVTIVAATGIFIVMMGITLVAMIQEQPGERVSDNHVRTDWTESILGKAERGEITWPYESWDYTQYHSSHRWITDKIWKQEYKYLKDGRNCKDIWDADAAYVIGDPGFYMYCIRFQEDVVRLHVEAEEELDAEEITVLKEKLQIP